MATTTAAVAQVPAEVANLLENSVLVTLRQSRYGTTKKIKDDSILSADDTDKSRLSVTKRILVASEIDAVSSIDTEIRKYVKSVTIQSFEADGIHFLNIAKVVEVDTQLKAYMQLRESAVLDAAAALPRIIEESRTALGPLADSSEFPTEQEFIEAYAMSYNFMSLGVPTNLQRVAPEIFEQEVAKREGGYMDALGNMKALMRANYRDVMEKLIERLDGKRENGKIKIFRASIVTNITDFLESFAFRNLAEDAGLASLIEQTKSLLDGITADDLREQEDLRSNTLAGARFLLDQLSKLN